MGERQQLQVIAEWVRECAGAYPWFAQAIRDALWQVVDRDIAVAAFQRANADEDGFAPPPPEPSEADRLAEALHRLGGLADLGQDTPIVFAPERCGDDLRDAMAQLEWALRHSVDMLVELPPDEAPSASGRWLSLNDALRFRALVKAWAAEEERARDAEPTPPVPASQPDTAPEPPFAADLLDRLILRDLFGASPASLMTVKQIRERLSCHMISRKRIGAALAAFERQGVAERPDGRNGGVRLTRTGRALCEQMSRVDFDLGDVGRK